MRTMAGRGRRLGGSVAALSVGVGLSACAGDVKVGPKAIESKKPSGYVEMERV